MRGFPALAGYVVGYLMQLLGARCAAEAASPLALLLPGPALALAHVFLADSSSVYFYMLLCILINPEFASYYDPTLLY